MGTQQQETLQELQELYEDKLVTYPRTDSQYITEDMEQSTMETLGGAAGDTALFRGEYGIRCRQNYQ